MTEAGMSGNASYFLSGKDENNFGQQVAIQANAQNDFIYRNYFHHEQREGAGCF